MLSEPVRVTMPEELIEGQPKRRTSDVMNFLSTWQSPTFAWQRRMQVLSPVRF